MNDDDYADLIVGVPGADVNSVTSCGAVYILFGGDNGVKTAGSLEITAEFPGIDRECEAHTGFGAVLCIGQFNGNAGNDLSDLVIGHCSRSVLPWIPYSGEVYVLYGAATFGSNTQIINRDTPGVPGVPEAFDGFGSKLETRYFNSDVYEDLTIFDSTLTPVITLLGSSNGLKIYSYQ